MVLLLESKYALRDVSLFFNIFLDSLVDLRQLVFSLPMKGIQVASPLLLGDNMREKALRISYYFG
jgi:hypothetical protein